jgi:hypothetical protein
MRVTVSPEVPGSTVEFPDICTSTISAIDRSFGSVFLQPVARYWGTAGKKNPDDPAQCYAAFAC